jgi:putative oxidoreductase
MRRFYPGFIGGFGGVALLLLRLCVGAAFILHGWPKIQNPFGWMQMMGMDHPAPSALQALGALAEFGGGIALVLGLLTPLAALGIICQMIGALLLVHLPHGDPFVAQGPSFERAPVYLTIGIALLALGPGLWSVDALLFGRRSSQPE